MNPTVSRGELLVDHVRTVVETIQRAYAHGPGRQPSGPGAAQVAALRRADPTRVGDDPAAWGMVLEGFPAALQGRETDEGLILPSREESAAHAAVCLYALHQQSHGDPVHRRGVRPGGAFAALARARGDGELSASVVERIHAASSSTSLEARLHALRTLITLMRAEASPTITLDYGLLARDLAALDNPHLAARVRLTWGRDLHTRPATPPSPTSGDQ